MGLEYLYPFRVEGSANNPSTLKRPLPEVRRAHDERDRLSLVQRIFDDQQERAGGQPTTEARAR